MKLFEKLKKEKLNKEKNGGSKKSSFVSLSQLAEHDALQITLLEESEEHLQLEESDLKFEKVTFGDIVYKVNVKNTDNDLTKYKKEFISDYILYAIYTKEMGYDNAFFEQPKRNIVSLIEVYGSNVLIKEIVKEDDISLEDIGEASFGGSSNHHIDVSLSEIKSEFQKKSQKPLFILLLALLTLFSLVYYLFIFGDAKIVKEIPPRPQVIHLTQVEKNHLSRSVSLEVVNRIKEEIENYKEGKEDKKLRRITSFSMSGMLNIAPVEPFLVNDDHWEFPPGPRRGGISYVTSKVTEQVFAGVGYSHTQDDLYSKEKGSNPMADENYFLENKKDLKKLILSDNCLTTGLSLPGIATPIRRGGDEVLVQVEDINGSVVVNDILPFIKKCPVYIRSLMQTEDRFTFNFLLYKGSTYE